MKIISQKIAAAALIAGAAATVQAATLTAPDTTFGPETFDSLANSGTSSTVPTDWAFAETGSGNNTTYTAGTGSANGGDTYSFGVAGTNAVTDRAFGGLRSGSVIPTIGSVFTNSTGGLIGSVTITYDGEQWRLGAAGRADRLDFQYSTDATSLTTGTWTDVNALDFTAPTTAGTVGALDGNASANRTAGITNTFSLPTPVANGSTFWIRYNDFDATGSDDGLAIDNFSISGAVPEPASLGVLGLGAVGLLARRRRLA